MLGDSAEGGTVQRWLCARREGSRALPRAKPRTGALFAAAQGGYAARGGGAGVASHPESTSGAGGGGGGTLDGGATGFAICAATGAATGWCSAGTCGADTAALGAGSAAGASSSGVSQSPSRSSLPTATGEPSKASGTSPRFRPARPVESRAPAAFSVPPASRAWDSGGKAAGSGQFSRARFAAQKLRDQTRGHRAATKTPDASFSLGACSLRRERCRARARGSVFSAALGLRLLASGRTPDALHEHQVRVLDAVVHVTARGLHQYPPRRSASLYAVHLRRLGRFADLLERLFQLFLEEQRRVGAVLHPPTRL